MADEPGAERPDDLEEEEGGPVKSFLEHLEDLRWVLIKSLVALVLGMFICLVAGNHVVAILKRPLDRAKVWHPGTNQIVTAFFGTNELGTFPLTPEQQAALELGTHRRTFPLTPEQQAALELGTNRFVAVQIEPAAIGTNQVLAWRVNPALELARRAGGWRTRLIDLGPAGAFFVGVQVAFYGGMVLASPFIFYFVATFVFPALRMREKKYVYRGLGFGLSLFLIGIAFCYFLLMPVALAASQRYSQLLGFSAFQWKADEYISFVCKFMLGMGLGFEMPVVILTLVKLGILNYGILSKGRKYMIVINLILGAVLTTPEVITQIIMFV